MTLIEGNMSLDLLPKLKEHFLVMAAHKLYNTLHHGNGIFVKTEGQVVLFQISDALDFLSVIDFPLKNVFKNIFLSPLSIWHL